MQDFFHQQLYTGHTGLCHIHTPPKNMEIEFWKTSFQEVAFMTLCRLPNAIPLGWTQKTGHIQTPKMLVASFTSKMLSVAITHLLRSQFSKLGAVGGHSFLLLPQKWWSPWRVRRSGLLSDLGGRIRKVYKRPKSPAAWENNPQQKGIGS